jgi:hypothetical protein
VRSKVVIAFGVVFGLSVGGAPTIAAANVYSCSGWAEGPLGSRVDAWISPEVTPGARAEWTPPHTGNGPISLRLSYDVRRARITQLNRIQVEGELGSGDDSRSTGFVSLTLNDRIVWRDAWRAERVPALSPSEEVPFALVLVASDRPDYPSDVPKHPERLAAVEQSRSIRVVAVDRAGASFSDSAYDVSRREDRDQLFRLAYETAVRALQRGCGGAETKCECGG